MSSPTHGIEDDDDASTTGSDDDVQLGCKHTYDRPF
jgi:hypothetical protein